VEFFSARRDTFPDMHVYHYNHTEKSTIERLMRDAEDENLFAGLVESGLFVDLFLVAKNALRVGTESYGLKHLEHLVGFERTAGIEHGAGAVVEYEQWMTSKDDGTCATSLATTATTWSRRRPCATGWSSSARRARVARSDHHARALRARHGRTRRRTTPLW